MNKFEFSPCFSKSHIQDHLEITNVKVSANLNFQINLKYLAKETKWEFKASIWRNKLALKYKNVWLLIQADGILEVYKSKCFSDALKACEALSNLLTTIGYPVILSDIQAEEYECEGITENPIDLNHFTTKCDSIEWEEDKVKFTWGKVEVEI